MNIKTILTVLFVLLLYPLKMPQGEDVDSLYDKLEDTLSTADDWVPCSQVFRVDTCGRYLDSVWIEDYWGDSDEPVRYYFVGVKLCTTLVRDTTVYVGE